MCCEKNAKGTISDNYATLTARTGIAHIATPNSSLTGSGNITAVITAGQSGTLIKSVRIKADSPVTQGMVRLFIGTGNASRISLFKEVAIPTFPTLASTPMPVPILPTYEINLVGDFKLASGYKLYATTQNAQGFNIMADGLDWEYPATPPATCCNFKQETAVTGLGTISTTNPVNIFTAPATNGSLVKSITIKALQSTNEGMISLYMNDGSKSNLFREIRIPQTTQSSFEPSYKIMIEDNLYVEAGFSIEASTQVGESFAITIEAIDWVYA